MHTLKIFLFALWVSTFAFGSLEHRENVNITSDNLQFTHEMHEGDLLSCKHTIENSLSQDWSVICGDSSTLKRFRVHLWVTRYTRPIQPKVLYEILYWVSDFNSSYGGSSHSGWYTLDEVTSLTQLTLRQSTDYDTGSLRLSLKVR